MSAFVVVEKLSLKKEQIEGEKLVLDQASIIHTKLNRDDVAEFIQEGQHLVLKLKNGEVIIIENFFTQFEQDLVSDLVFEDDECAFLWFDWNNGVPVFKELAGLEALLPIASNAGSIAPLILGGAALVGGGIAIAENRDNDKSPAQPGNTPPQVEVIIGKDGTITIKYPDNVDPESINPDDIIIKDKNGNPIDVGLEKGDDNTLTGKVPEGIDGDITVTVPEGSYEDKDGNPGGEGSDSSEVVPTPPVEDQLPPQAEVIIDEDGKITVTYPKDVDPESIDPKDFIIKDKDGNPIDGVVFDKPIIGENGDIKIEGKVPADVEGKVTVDVPAGSYEDKAGNPGLPTGADKDINMVPPTVKVIINDDGTVSFEFSEEVQGFDPNDVTVENGTISGLTQDPNDPTKWTADLTPKAGFEGDVTVTVEDDSYSDLAGNTGKGDSDNTTVDTKAPTVKVIINDDGTVSFEFSEEVQDFDPTDVSVENGTISGLTQDPNDPTKWTADLTPKADFEGDVTVTVEDDSYSDLAGNTGKGNSDNTTVDTKAPTVKVIINDDGTVSFEFSEEVQGFDPNDVSVENGTISGLTQDKNDPTKWTADLTPKAGFEGDVTVTVEDDSYSDLAGNTGKGDLDNTTVDTKAPTVKVIINDDGTVSFEFSEEVQGFDPSDVSVENGTISGLTQDPNDPTKWTADLTPKAGFEGDVTVTVKDDSYSDLAGNTGKGDTDKITVDTKAPTVEVTINEDGTVSFKFSEEVKDFNPEDITIENGKISGLRQDPKDPTRWIADLTPDAGVEGDVTVTVKDDSYSDLADNTGKGDTDKITVDTKAPTVEVTINEDGTVSFKFSEEVKDFNPEDITIENGKISGLRQDPKDPTRWIADLTPDEGVEGDVTVTVEDDSYSDLAGNTGKGDTDSTPVDTIAPTVKVTINKDGTVSFEFSEEVKDFNPEDITIENGKISGLRQDPNDPTRWIADLTPDTDFKDDVTVTVKDDSYSDLAGNKGKGDTDSTPVDTIAPTVKVTINKDGTVSFEFSEEVKDFNPEDITIENGKISGLRQDPNDPTRWIADLTPDAGVEGDVTVTVKDDSYSDLADNTGKGDSDKITVDTKAPTVKVDIDDVNKNSVTFTFSEIPHGADGQPLTAEELKALIKSKNADIDFDNLVTEDGGLTWTAPIQAKHEGEIKIEIAVDEDHFYKDAAGNTGTPGEEAVVIVKPPKVEQETALNKPEVTGGNVTDSEGNILGNHFESRQEATPEGDPEKFTEHKLKFTIDKGQDPNTIRAVINLDKLDNSFMIWVNGVKIANTGVFQVQDNDDTHKSDQINLVFRNGEGEEDTWLSEGNPWELHKTGLPRFQIVITDKGVRFYATRNVNSKELEEIFFQNEEDLKKLNKIVFQDEVNEIIVGSADGTGADAIKGYLNVTVGGQFVITDEDSSTIESMTIVITDAKLGDELIPVLPYGIEGVPVYVDGVLTLVLTGLASKQDYQDALNALMFKGTIDGGRNISIKVKDSSGLESEIANGSIDYKVSEGTITIGQFDYSVSKVAALAGDDEINTGDTGHDALIYDVLDAADAKAGHGVDTWSDFHLGAMADDADADVIQFSQDFFDGLLDDQSNISEFISVDYDAATQQAIISIDRDGQGVGYGQEKFLVLDNQTQDFDLQKLLENQQIIIG